MKGVRNANNKLKTKTKEVLDTWQDYQIIQRNQNRRYDNKVRRK